MNTLMLTRSDRCDRCVGEALVAITLRSGGTILLCGHHFHEHEPALRDIGADIWDTRVPVGAGV